MKETPNRIACAIYPPLSVVAVWINLSDKYLVRTEMPRVNDCPCKNRRGSMSQCSHSLG